MCRVYHYQGKSELGMTTSDITDPLLHQAVVAIDAGNLADLQHLLATHPHLVSTRLTVPDEGYFSHPYLLWFVADNPVRNGTLPANSIDITRLLIQEARQHAADSFQNQLDYTLGLVTTGRVARECGVQLDLIDLLIDAGAVPGEGHGTLAHGNKEAAQRLMERGGHLTLATAIGLNRTDDIIRLAGEATVADRQVALMVAAFYGQSDWLTLLIQEGVDVDGYLNPSSGFHSHATALHQAVYSGSLESVKRLVEAGAALDLEDLAYQGTPLGWAMHRQSEATDEPTRQRYEAIEAYLRSKMTEQVQP